MAFSAAHQRVAHLADLEDPPRSLSRLVDSDRQVHPAGQQDTQQCRDLFIALGPEHRDCIAGFDPGSLQCRGDRACAAQQFRVGPASRGAQHGRRVRPTTCVGNKAAVEHVRIACGCRSIDRVTHPLLRGWHQRQTRLVPGNVTAG